MTLPCTRVLTILQGGHGQDKSLVNVTIIYQTIVSSSSGGGQSLELVQLGQQHQDGLKIADNDGVCACAAAGQLAVDRHDIHTTSD